MFWIYRKVVRGLRFVLEHLGCSQPYANRIFAVPQITVQNVAIVDSGDFSSGIVRRRIKLSVASH